MFEEKGLLNGTEERMCLINALGFKEVLDIYRERETKRESSVKTKQKLPV